MHPLIEDIKKQYKSGSALMKLIFINVAAFVLLHLAGMVLWLLGTTEATSMLSGWFSLPADFGGLIYQPWTLITYMFLHEGIMHLALNLLVLYFSGQIFLQFLDAKKLVVTYLLGGLMGGLFYMMAFNLFPVFDGILSRSFVLGASASVIAILFAIALYVPDFVVRLVFLGNVKLKYIALVYVVLDIVSIPKGNAGGHIAHLGGAFFGYLYITQLKKGKDFTLGFSRFLDTLKAYVDPDKKMKVVYRRTGKTRSDKAYNQQKNDNQKAVDAILDKIAVSGYDSLTAQEKAILFDASRK